MIYSVTCQESLRLVGADDGRNMLPLWSRKIEVFPDGLVIRPTSGATALIWVEPRN